MKHPHSTNGAQHALTEKQLRFVEEYLIDLNAAAAYKRAGYKATGRAAGNAASRLLQTPAIQAAIGERLAASKQASVLSVERVELELQRLAMVDVRRLFKPDGSLKSPHEWDDDVAAAVAAIDVREEFGEDGAVIGRVTKIKIWDKRAAIVDLLKRRDLAGKGELGNKDSPMMVKVIEIVRPANAPPPAADQGKPAA
jgi:phage terminase small subunit